MSNYLKNFNNVKLIKEISKSEFENGLVFSKSKNNVVQIINLKKYPHFYDLLEHFKGKTKKMVKIVDFEITNMFSLRNSNDEYTGRIFVTLESEEEAYRLLKTKNGENFDNEYTLIKIK